jgi:murein DD-endopeptidase MepM/ murein hydrolase activator NlpD
MEGVVMADELNNLPKVNNFVEKLAKNLNGILTTLTKISGVAGPAMQKVMGATSAGGTMGNGVGTSLNLGVNPATFSSSVMPWMGVNAARGAIGGAGQMVGGVAKGVMGVAAGMYTAMPDLGTTVARASGYYGAASMGGMNRTSLAKVSMGALNQGITGMGEDAAAAAMLVQGMYYNPKSAAFTKTMADVGGAARGFNMPNATAAQALGGFQQGPQAGGLYAAGIMTLDSQGNPLPFEDIAKQLYKRSFAGRTDISREDVLRASQGGFLGADLRANFAPAQQELLVRAMGNFAEGKGFNLAAQTGAGNPSMAAYQINSSQTDLMQRGEQPMLQGFNTAADAVTRLNKAMEGLPDLMFQFKGAIQGFLGTQAGQGTAVAAGGVMSGVKSFFGGVRKVVGAGMTAAGVLTADPLLALAGTAVMGGGQSGFGASFGAKGGGGDTQSPIPGMSVTTGYGAKDAGMWKGSNNKHTGQDYAAAVGTDVQVVADGTVIDEGLDSGYGIYVQVDHGSGYQTIYGHLSEKKVKVGDAVKKGKVIGKVGTTGNVTGPHLHFEVRKGKNNPVDPSTFIGNGTLQTTSGAVGAQTGGVVLATGDKKDWATQFLTKLGKPVTDANLTAVSTWMAYEGGHWKNSANYNPLNTTLKTSGATGSMNKVGVKRYDSWDSGLDATVQTIKANKYGYPSILDALSKGNDTAGVLSAVNHSKWGTHIPGYGGGQSGFGASIPAEGRVTSTSGNNVVINLSVQNASDDEAIRFAKKVEKYLTNKGSIATMGRN